MSLLQVGQNSEGTGVPMFQSALTVSNGSQAGSAAASGTSRPRWVGKVQPYILAGIAQGDPSLVEEHAAAESASTTRLAADCRAQLPLGEPGCRRFPFNRNRTL